MLRKRILKLMQLSKLFHQHKISVKIQEIGNDLNICIFGGDEPHIGAVALGIPITLPHDPLTQTSSVSLMTVPGHKEDEFALRVARQLTKQLNKVIVVSCGIHIQDIKKEEIFQLSELLDDIINELLSVLA